MSSSRNNYSQSLRIMVTVGLLVALGIVLQAFSIQLPFMRIGVSPLPTIISGLLLGPVWGGVTGLLKDMVGFLLAPPATGTFFPPITAIQVLYGVIPPLLLPLFRKPVDWIWGKVITPERIGDRLRSLASLPARLVTCFLVVAATQFIAGGLLMPAALNLLFDGQLTWNLYVARFTARLPQQGIHLLAYPLLTYMVMEALENIPARMKIGQAALSRHS